MLLRCLKAAAVDEHIIWLSVASKHSTAQDVAKKLHNRVEAGCLACQAVLVLV